MSSRLPPRQQTLITAVTVTETTRRTRLATVGTRTRDWTTPTSPRSSPTPLVAPGHEAPAGGVTALAKTAGGTPTTARPTLSTRRCDTGPLAAYPHCGIVRGAATAVAAARRPLHPSSWATPPPPPCLVRCPRRVTALVGSRRESNGARGVALPSLRGGGAASPLDSCPRWLAGSQPFVAVVWCLPLP